LAFFKNTVVTYSVTGADVKEPGDGDPDQQDTGLRANADQAALWDGTAGEHRVRHADQDDAEVSLHNQWLRHATGIGPADRVLDIGCGTGQSTLGAAHGVVRFTTPLAATSGAVPAPPPARSSVTPSPERRMGSMVRISSRRSFSVSTRLLKSPR
jgi:SAM-dependent methyltransferase